MSTAGGDFVIGNYRVSKTIGEGTFGKVRLGVHMPTEMKVAIKTLQKQKIVEQADIERVTRQICILKILRHPNIVQLYQIIETKTDIHLIMEYASGGQLFDYIVKKKRLEETEAVAFMQQILSGVDYIHKIGIVHRDLKPENLLFDQNKNIKIVDFGLSNQYKPGERLKTACGSPCYAAPQMIAGKKYECLNIDIWSCGIILYAMLCGYLPFEDPNTNKLYKKIMSGDYEQPKVLTSEGRQILRRILNVDPQTRYKINQIKQSKWYNLIAEKYEAKGIIVGSDQIDCDDRVIVQMKKMGVTAQATQIRNYVSNNRHNSITAFYYLVKKKQDKYPSFLQSEGRQQKKSPFYRPQIKGNIFLPSKKKQDQRERAANESFNASKIVSSLVEANRNKLIHNKDRYHKKQQNFDKVEQFKIFPRYRNNSQFENGKLTPDHQQAQRQRQQRSESEDNKAQIRGISEQQHWVQPTKSHIEQGKDKTENSSKHCDNSQTNTEKSKTALEQGKQQTPKDSGQPADHPEPSSPAEQIRESKDERKRSQLSAKNKRREELSDQLKQISLKIDKEITQLRKHNNISSSIMTQKRRQSFGAPAPHITKFKIPERASNGPGPSEQRAQPESLKLTMYSSTLRSFRRCTLAHSTSPRVIVLRIVQYLRQQSISYKEIDAFTIRLDNHEVISIESIHGISGYHIVKFSQQHSLNQKIIEFVNS